jgi:hypothetical protein
MATVLDVPIARSSEHLLVLAPMCELAWDTHHVCRTWREKLVGRPLASPQALGREADTAAKTYAVALLEETREEVDRADRKAQVLLASTGVVIAVLFGVLNAGRWSPFRLDVTVQWLWWIGLGEAVLGVWAMAASIFPRTGRRGQKNNEHIYYFGDVLKQRTSGDLVAALRRSANSDLERLADQIRQVSLTAHRKYRLIQTAMWLLLASLICGSSSVILSAVL